MSTFGGIQTALSGLWAQKIGLETTTNNVTNANTPGYHRQAVDLVEGPGVPAPGLDAGGPGQIGGGVLVGDIRRMVNPLAVANLRSQLSQQGAANAQQDVTSQVQNVFNSLGSRSIGNLMSQFWGGWGDVANSPTDLGVRSSLVSKAQTLAATIQQTYSQLSSQRQSLNDQIGQDVTTINGLSSQVAALNTQIVEVKATGQSPNALLDQRDQLIGKIADLVGVSVAEEPSGAVQVSVNGQAIVDGGSATALQTTTDANGMRQIQASNGSILKPTDGALSARENLRDVQIGGWMSQLDAWANRLMTAVNAAQTGTDPKTGAPTTNVYNLAAPGTVSRIPFFTGTGAANLAVNAAIAGNPSLIAASRVANGPGDGSNALAIASLQNDPTAGGQPAGGPTLDAQYRALSVNVGNAASTAQAAAADQSLLVQHLQQLDSQVGGVSLDEEGAKLVTYQRSYQAAARALTTFDNMLDTLINRTGSVGR